MAQRDAALQAARDHRIGDHAREHVVRLEMLVEVDIDRQPGLLRQIEQRRQRAPRIGAGIEACADQAGAHCEGKFEAIKRARIGQIVLRGRERDDIDIEPVRHTLLRRQHAFDRSQLDDGIDVGVGPDPRDPVLDRPFEQAHGPRRDIGGSEQRTRRGGGRHRVGERARPERLHRVGTIGMGMQVDEAGEREPGSLAGLFDRPHGRDQAVAQRHLERTAAPRQQDGSYREFIRHRLRNCLRRSGPMSLGHVLNIPAVRTPRSQTAVRAPGRSDISSPAPHRSSAGCAGNRSPAPPAAR
jgi:hypothetical protein